MKRTKRISPGGYIDMWRAMQQFEGRSAATVLRDDAQRSRVEAHAVQLNLEAHGGQVVVVLKRGKARKWIQQRFWGMILVWNVYPNHNLCPWNHLKPNSQWWFAIRYNTQRHRFSKSEKMPSCKIFVSDLGPKTWKIALLSCESGWSILDKTRALWEQTAKHDKPQQYIHV